MGLNVQTVPKECRRTCRDASGVPRKVLFVIRLMVRKAVALCIRYFHNLSGSRCGRANLGAWCMMGTEETLALRPAILGVCQSHGRLHGALLDLDLRPGIVLVM